MNSGNFEGSSSPYTGKINGNRYISIFEG